MTDSGVISSNHKLEIGMQSCMSDYKIQVCDKNAPSQTHYYT